MASHSSSAAHPTTKDDSSTNSVPYLGVYIAPIASPQSLGSPPLEHYPLTPLASTPIRCVVWDFDLTLLRIHSFATRVTVESILGSDGHGEGRLEDWVDGKGFVSLVDHLKAGLLTPDGSKPLACAIASFGRYEVIQAYCDKAWERWGGEGAAVPFDRTNILTPSSVGSTDGCALKGGKNLLLSSLCVTWGLHPREVLFFDGTPYLSLPRVFVHAS
jgi:hypothetical protein